MIIHTYGQIDKPSLLLLPGLGGSYELFLPLIGLLSEKYYMMIRRGRQSRMSKRLWAGIWIVPMAFRWEARFCQGCWNGMKFPFAMPYWMPHLCSLCRDGVSGFCITTNASTCGHVTIVRDSGRSCFTRTISMSFLTNAGKCGLMVKADHLLRLDPMAHIEVFPGMNHGQLLVDSPEKVGSRIAAICGI